MKKTITLLALSTLFSMISCWNGAFAQEPLTFTGSILNPLLIHGDPGSCDEMLVAPFGLWDDDTFYIYYTGNAGACIATSPDGYNYYKIAGNPVLGPSDIGFDSLGAASGPVIKIADSEYAMYYNARQYPGWGPGESCGRATANNPAGPWLRSSEPALTIGSPGEWDEGLISPLKVIPLDTGSFIMFYYASHDFNGTWLMGMATSPDGITWTKYNDPDTTDPPYAESDPIIPAGASGEFDEWGVLGAGVFTAGGYYHMYYCGLAPGPVTGYRTDIGYAYSTDGINWEKWPENPVYVQENDPYFDYTTMIFEQPTILVKDSTIYLYYDYGTVTNSLGMAVAENVWVGINENKIPGDELRITNHPNPAIESTTFSCTLSQPMHVKFEIFDSFGRLVEELIDNKQQKGEQRITCNTETYPAGIYFYRFQSDDTTCGGKMVVVK
ncbi:MAG: T9SS type A sorting domain-containing protein [Bacteroidota bacterium]